MRPEAKGNKGTKMEMTQDVARVLAIASVLVARLLREMRRKKTVEIGWVQSNEEIVLQAPPIPSSIYVRDVSPGSKKGRQWPGHFRRYELTYTISSRYRMEVHLLCGFLTQEESDPWPKEIGIKGPISGRFRWWRKRACNDLLEANGLTGISHTYWNDELSAMNGGGPLAYVWYVP